MANPPSSSAQALPFHTSTGITAGFNENAGRSFESKHEDWNPDEMPAGEQDSGINVSEGTSGTSSAA